MNQRQMELEQLFLDEEKLTLKKLKENYADALADIDEKIAILQGRQDADMEHVVYQIEYQKALKGQVSAILEQMNVNNFETVSEYLETSYEQGFIGTLYDIQGQGIPLIMPIDQKQAVIAIRHESKLSEDLYTALGKDTKVLSKQIASEITRGIASALPYKEISRNVAAKAGISQNNAMRIARTEAHRIQNKAIADAQWKAKEKGADIVKIWSAALDGKTRDTHRRLDGQIRELDEPFEIDGMEAMEPGGFGDPAEDINCRCRCNSKARWLLDAEQTKHLGNTDKMTDEQLQPIADKLGIDVDELRKYSDQIIPVNAKNYDDFRRKYEKLVNNDNVERVRSNVQKMNSLENGGKSSTIKAITIDDIRKSVEGSSISNEVAAKTASVLEKHDALDIFDTVRSSKINDNSILNTVPDKIGTFFDISFEFNEANIGGMGVEEIDNMFKNANNTVANSLEDAIVHEIYHARLIKGLNYDQMFNLYDELDEIHITGFSSEAYKSGAECISEVGVMIERGESSNVPKEAMDLFKKYMGDKYDKS